MDPDKIQRSSKFWDNNIRIHEEKQNYIHWMDSPLVQEFCLKKLPLGNNKIPAPQWIAWFKEKYARTPFCYGLSLGCGDGTLERYAVQNKICERIDSFDNSKNSIKIAKQLCKNNNLEQYIRYEQKDINEIKLEKNKYDVIFIGAAAHHFENLEHIFFELKNGLKPNGLLVINEFIGPTQFQWDEKQLKIMNDLLDLLPKSLKMDKTTNKIKTKIHKPTIEAMNALDPSEAIRSSEIVPVLTKYFRIIERIDYGGTILHLLLYGIIDNFASSDEKDICILKMLGYFEDLLISEKILSSDFTIIVAKNDK
jgi:2-polyprenyl-3-methyl-5-hydroxy-6-metoxy-1,4-benzoquinol methylase